MDLTATEQRVLGCLIEKEATTPEQYPLSINALVAACNQSTNRDPVVGYDESLVLGTLTALREQHLIRIVYPAHARVTKYRQVLGELLALSRSELAVLAVLLLRGAQTVNELAARTERYTSSAEFADMGGVEGVLARLAARPEPLVRHLARRPGQREDRYAHLLGDAPDVTEAGDFGVDGENPAAQRQSGNSARLDALELETANLRREFEQLRELINSRLSGEPTRGLAE